MTTTVNWTQVVAAGEAAGLKTVALERLDRFLMKAGLLEQLGYAVRWVSNAEEAMADVRLAEDLVQRRAVAAR